MIKLFTLVAISAACFAKLSVTSFKEQMEYPGIQSGKTYVNYSIEIDNPKEEEITIEKIWVKGNWIDFQSKDYSGNPIIVNTSVEYKFQNSREKIKSPTKNENDQGAIQYRLKGKSKIKYIGIEHITKEEPLARP